MRRFKHIVLSILVVLLVIAGTVTIVLASGKIQTLIAQRVAYQLSKKTETEVQIESVKYYFPARAVVRGIYIEDQQQDTLAYVDKVVVGLFKPLFGHELFLIQLFSGAKACVFYPDVDIGAVAAEAYQISC